MEKIIDIIDSIAYEKGLNIKEVEVALVESLIKTAEKMIDATLTYDADIDRGNKKLNLFQKVEVVKNDDQRLEGIDTITNDEGETQEIEINKENYISIDEAKDIDSDLEVGDFLSYDLEFEDMGRNAASILFNNFEYRVQRYIEDNLFKKYNSQIGKTINSVVTSVDRNENTFMEIGEVRAILPRKNRIKGESFRVGDSVKAVVRAVRVDKQHGLIVEISRTSPKFLESLLALEVPELKDERIVIESSARIPGVRSKIAISTTEQNLDPIGAIVGVKGVRINAVSGQLNGESIDCIDYSPIDEIFISRALSPAAVNSVKVDTPKTDMEKGKAVVTINSDQKGKAIGKAGLNIRLASMLTKYDLEIVEVDGVTPNQDNTQESVQPKKDVASLEALFK
ncbi:MAG TPA: transcription termination/antitermination protein NusA [Arcobacter sp.]|jgi:N utilization substance protein A|nr:transcription termination/antitermination protein NusA [Arcobacter sp.]